MHPENLNGRLVTANGSYVGLYGIIYLDDRDEKAYFNGRLVFYKEDSFSQIIQEMPIKLGLCEMFNKIKTSL